MAWKLLSSWKLVPSVMFIVFVVICECDMSSFDCPMRVLALQYAQHIQPHLSMAQLQEIADALNGSPEAQNCNMSASHVFRDLAIAHSIPPQRTSPSWNDIGREDLALRLFVDANHGSDSRNNGLSVHSPFKSIAMALDEVHRHRTMGTMEHDPAMIVLRGGIYYLQSTLHFNRMHSNLIITNFNGEHVVISGAVPLYNCSWQIYRHTEDGYHIYSVNLKDSLTLKLTNASYFDGLRVNGTRAVRARYPNANPEIDGFGSSLTALRWFPSLVPAMAKQQVYITDAAVRNESATGEFVYYQAGVGGICEQFSPPMGYWCGNRTQGGGAETYQVPHGLVYNESILPNAPYQNASSGIVSVWRPSHWATWFFKIGGYDAQQMHINFSVGGFQGARGSENGAEFFVENVFEELDTNQEWFWNDTQFTLFFYNNLTNKTAPTCDDQMFEVTHLKTLMDFSGTQSAPVQNVTIRGITFKDAAYTEFEPHAMPSGGDWSLQRIGALTITGAEFFNISHNIFTRNDGIALVLNGYNRHINIEKNEFVWNGDTAIALVGDTVGFSFNDSTTTTMGYDGTTGTQPRYITVASNYAHELGLFEKQSSFYFQAKSCLNQVRKNIFFNGPRAGINFNDGFGGGSSVESNLLFNTCRESGDHGPFNSWDRQPYVTNVRNGTASTRKAYDYISKNFMIGNYATQNAVDNDDGSCYYKIFENFLVYAPNGQKSDSGGHDNQAFCNIYAYIYVRQGWDWWGPTCFHDFTTQRIGHSNYYYNNTCIINNGSMSDAGQPAVRIGYAKWIGCDDSGITLDVDYAAWTATYNNSIYIDRQPLGLCNMTETEFQQKTQLDPGTVVYAHLPNDQELLSKARQLLW